MSDHIFEKLGAYLDGELNSRDHNKVEKHLEQCISCQEEYESLRSLSSTLQEDPLPDFPSAKRLSADVALRLPRKEEASVEKKVLEVGWWLTPLGLVSAWIFISTTNLLSEMLEIAQRVGLIPLSAEISSQTYFSTALGQFGFLAGNNLQWAEMVEAFTRYTTAQIIFQISIAILYLSWMAIWWARHADKSVGRALEN